MFMYFIHNLNQYFNGLLFISFGYVVEVLIINIWVTLLGLLAQGEGEDYEEKNDSTGGEFGIEG